MTKLSFFSIPRNKTRKETIELIKTALIANGWKFDNYLLKLCYKKLNDLHRCKN